MASRRDLSRWGLVVLALALACGDDAPAPEEAPLAPVAAPSSIDAPLAPVARLSTADRWIDLIAQRPSAVTTAGDRTLVELGRPAAQIHAAMVAGETWRFGQEIEGRRAGVVLGRGAALELPVDGPLAPLFLQARPEGERAGAGEASLGMAITLRALAKDQLVTVLWNETPLANLSVREDWERRTFSLPPGLVRAGENRLRLHFRRTAAYGELGEVSAAVATVELGRIEDIRAGPPPPADPYRVDPVRDGAELLTLPAGRGLAFYVLAPNRGKLRIGRGRMGDRLIQRLVRARGMRFRHRFKH